MGPKLGGIAAMGCRAAIRRPDDISLDDLQDDVAIPASGKESSMTAIGPTCGLGFLYWPGAKPGLDLEGMYHFPIADETKIAFDSSPSWTVGASVVFELGKTRSRRARTRR
jgi:hypothetical protein